MNKIEKHTVPGLSGLYHHVLWTVTPRPVWIVGTCNEDDTANFSTITCVSNTPGPPENIIISISARRTIANIVRTGEFSANLCNVEMAGLADYVGSVSGEDGAKDGMDYTYTWGKKIRVPVLDASPAALECKLSHAHVLGMFHTFFGEVMDAHFSNTLMPASASREDAVNWFCGLDIHEIDPLVYHSVKKYYRVGEKL
ncbi:MAG: flavin reductase family protein [Defluviitaleaceae bacterium]|nr:flavin reductase family protein [Defluviitaleaceae bacterium]